MTDEELPPRVRRAEERRAFRELLAKSSLGCPTGDCDHGMEQHVADRWINEWPTNPRCLVPSCPCPVDDQEGSAMTDEDAAAKLQAQYQRFVDAVEASIDVQAGLRAVLIAGVQRKELEWSGKPLSDAEAGELVDDMLKARAKSRSVWTSPHEWRDPDCVECGGQGAPCCEPPMHPYRRKEAIVEAATRLVRFWEDDERVDLAFNELRALVNDGGQDGE